jgi:hypothetical protein
MIVTVHVTEDHIAHGIPESCSACPVALALIDTFPGSLWFVGNKELTRFESVSHFSSTYDLPMPENVRDFADEFDESPNNRSMKPFSFEITIPD